MPTGSADAAVETGRSFDHVVRTAGALVIAGAGLLHLDAAGDHTEHVHLAVFFVAAAMAQFGVAALLNSDRSNRRVFFAAVVVNAALLAVWLVSRTVGLRGIPDASGVEEIGWKDAATAGLELTGLAVLGLAAAMPIAARSARVTRRVADRALASIAVGTLALAVPGVLIAHTHDHGSAVHTHDGEVAAAVEVEDHTHAADVGHEHPAAEITEDGGHVHAEVVEGLPEPVITNESDGHDHSHVTTAPATGAPAGTAPAGTDGHVHDTSNAAFMGPAAPSPLEGPGTISTLRIGPIPLPPSIPGVTVPHLSPGVFRVLPGQVNLPMVGIPKPCTNCYVLGMVPDLVYADGSPANLDSGPMLHHTVLTEPSVDDPVCGRDGLVGNLGRRLFASGNERTGFALPTGFGIPVGSGTFAGVTELMNHSTQLKLVYIQVIMRWVPRSTPDIKPVTPVWLDIDSCGDSEFNVGKGISDRAWDWKSSITGRIVAAGGHVHDGGAWLDLADSTSGAHVCRSIAGYGTKPAYLGTIESMSYCAWDQLASVVKGDVLTLTAHYHTTAPAQGVMGIMMIFIHETNDLVGGTASPYPAEVPPDTGPAGPGGHSH